MEVDSCVICSVGLHVPIELRDSRLNRSCRMRAPHFVADDYNDDYDTQARDSWAVALSETLAQHFFV